MVRQLREDSPPCTWWGEGGSEDVRLEDHRCDALPNVVTKCGLFGLPVRKASDIPDVVVRCRTEGKDSYNGVCNADDVCVPHPLIEGVVSRMDSDWEYLGSALGEAAPNLKR